MDMETVVLRGIVTANFAIEIDVDDFAEICETYGLNPDNVKNFSHKDWLTLRGDLTDIVVSNDGDIEYESVYDHGTISVDEATVETDENDIITCTYEQGDAVHSIDIS
jgi:hypothetical protein